MQRFGWNDAHWTQAQASGFPKASGHRETYDKDGYPAGRTPWWFAEVIQQWKDNNAALHDGR